MLQFDCPHCGKVIRLREEFAGRKGSCPHCKNAIVAPAASRPAPRSQPARPAPPQAIPIAQEAAPEPAYYEADDDGAAEEPVITAGWH